MRFLPPSFFKAAASASSAVKPYGQPIRLTMLPPAIMANKPPPAGGGAADCCLEVALAVAATLIATAIISKTQQWAIRHAQSKYVRRIRQELPQLGADDPMTHALDRFDAAESDVERALHLTTIHNRFLEQTSEN
jgi:hypothetical protein